VGAAEGLRAVWRPGPVPVTTPLPSRESNLWRPSPRAPGRLDRFSDFPAERVTPPTMGVYDRNHFEGCWRNSIGEKVGGPLVPKLKMVRYRN
jgi:hypothetical protein